MSDTVSRAEFERVIKQSQRRKAELETLSKERDDLKKQLETAITEREKAVKESESVQEAYRKFTDENEIYKQLEEANANIRIRDLHDAFNGVEGVEYQDGVTLDDILQAAKLNPAEIDEITPEIVSQAIEAARASKPFLFATPQAQGEPQNTGEVRQEAASTPSLKAFGGQASGGGSAPPAALADPAKSVDWSDHRAVDRYFAERNGK